MKRLYLASGFFNPQQVAVVEKLETMICAIDGIELYSPRKDGVLINMTKEQRVVAGAKIFEINCREITMSDLLFAVIDDFDTGVVFEMGYAYGSDKIIVTYTEHDSRGLNIMLRGATSGHCRGIKQAELLLTEWVKSGDDAINNFHDFDPVTT